MNAPPTVTRVGPGVFRVEVEGRAEIVHVAGPRTARWVHWNGQVYERPFADTRAPRRAAGTDAHQSLTAPMPSTVRKVLVEPGSRVAKGDTLLVLEAMKMELPIRAGADAVVRAVHCREGQLVQPGATLVDLD